MRRVEYEIRDADEGNRRVSLCLSLAEARKESLRWERGGYRVVIVRVTREVVSP